MGARSADLASEPASNDGLIHRARVLTAMATREGLLVNDKPCRACGVAQGPHKGRLPLVILHHPDYRRPLWLIPLCRPCHAQVHAGLIPDPGLAARRRRSGDTYFCWQRDPKALDREIAQAVYRGMKPSTMRLARFEQELRDRGLIDAFAAGVIEREAQRAQWRAERAALQAG